jgi:ORF6N domain-containing protein
MAKKQLVPIIPDEFVMNKIYVIRGHKIMLDTDLAELYEVETRTLNQAVSRNRERFPPDFMFQLNTKEWTNLKSQSVMSSWGGRRTLPYVFTEHGVLMLSSVLSSMKSIQVNIQIMRVFMRIRQMLADNTELRLVIEKLEKKTDNNSKNIEAVFQYLDELIEKKEKQKPRKAIGYKISQKKTQIKNRNQT